MTKKKSDIEVDIDLISIETELFKKSYYNFFRSAWEHFEGCSYIDNWHIQAIAEHLEAFSSGQIRRLMINVPPGSSKTSLCTVAYPAWEWINNPEQKMMFVGYDYDVAKTSHLKWRKLVESDWYKERFGHIWQPNELKWGALKGINNKHGEREAASISGTATGKHYHKIFLDDPLKAQDIKREKEASKRAYEDFTGTFLSRAADRNTLGICVIAQRLEMKDVPGRLLERGGWEQVCIPLNYKPQLYTYSTLGKYDPRTEEGENFFPQRFPQAKEGEPPTTLDLEIMECGPYYAAAQYQQTPTPEGGGIIKQDWFKFYDEIPNIKHCRIIQSWDTALKKTESSDFTVGQVWAKKGPNFYLLDQIRGRMSYTEVCSAIKTLNEKWTDCRTIYIEETASGPAVIEALKKEGISGVVAVKQPKEGKISRVHSVTGLFEAGNVFFPNPENTKWMQGLIEEFCGFDRWPNDDQLDAAVQALIQLHKIDLNAALKTLKKMISW